MRKTSRRICRTIALLSGSYLLTHPYETHPTNLKMTSLAGSSPFIYLHLPSFPSKPFSTDKQNSQVKRKSLQISQKVTQSFFLQFTALFAKGPTSSITKTLSKFWKPVHSQVNLVSKFWIKWGFKLIIPLTCTWKLLSWYGKSLNMIIFSSK